MGTYAYTLRKQTRKVRTTDGTIDCNLMAFAYKERWDSSNSHDRAQATADRAWTETDHRLVALDFENGATVYTDVTKPFWYDSQTFPGRPVGYLRKQGGRWTLVDASPWEAYGQASGPVWIRTVAAQGTTYQETAKRDPDGSREPCWDIPGQEQPQAKLATIAPPKPQPVY